MFSLFNLSAPREKSIDNLLVCHQHDRTRNTTKLRKNCSIKSIIDKQKHGKHISRGNFTSKDVHA